MHRSQTSDTSWQFSSAHAHKKRAFNTEYFSDCHREQYLKTNKPFKYTQIPAVDK